MFDRWIHEQRDKENQALRHEWPFEQRVLEKMLNISSRDPSQIGVISVPSLEEKVGIIHAKTMNTPYGKFIRHLWTGRHGRYSPETRDVFDEVLHEFGIFSTTELNGVLDEIRRTSVKVISPPPEFLATLKTQIDMREKEKKKRN